MKLLLAFALGCALTLSLGFVAQTSKPPAYEYKVIRASQLKGDEKYNELGAEGWELIQTIPILSAGTTVETSLFFRRVKR